MFPHCTWNSDFTCNSEFQRKLRTLEKAQDATAVDKAPVKSDQHSAGPSTSTAKAASISPSVDKIDFALQVRQLFFLSSVS